jgi:hypothetical protein
MQQDAIALMSRSSSLRRASGAMEETSDVLRGAICVDVSISMDKESRD